MKSQVLSRPGKEEKNRAEIAKKEEKMVSNSSHLPSQHHAN
jgi:hypothetical protein